MIVYYLVRFDLRYRYPTLWISVLAAAYGMCRCMGHAASPQKRRHPAHSHSVSPVNSRIYDTSANVESP